MLRFQNIFRPHVNEKPEVLEYSGMKSVFEKHRFGDGLKLKLGFQILLAQCDKSLRDLFGLSEHSLHTAAAPAVRAVVKT